MSDERYEKQCDPAWVYFVSGGACFGGAILYAVFSNHASTVMFSPKWGRIVRTPIDIYLPLVGGGLLLVVRGVRKVWRSRKGRPDPE
jgi:hypothetical protein